MGFWGFGVGVLGFWGWGFGVEGLWFKGWAAAEKLLRVHEENVCKPNC